MRRQLLETHGIEIGAGLGAFAGNVWRIGLMGESSTQANVELVLDALESVLADHGHACPRGAGVAAAHAVYAAP